MYILRELLNIFHIDPLLKLKKKINKINFVIQVSREDVMILKIHSGRKISKLLERCINFLYKNSRDYKKFISRLFQRLIQDSVLCFFNFVFKKQAFINKTLEKVVKLCLYIFLILTLRQIQGKCFLMFIFFYFCLLD